MSMPYLTLHVMKIHYFSQYFRLLDDITNAVATSKLALKLCNNHTACDVVKVS